MKNKDIEKRLKKLEQDSHPPVNWKELIHSNIERINELESVNDKLFDIIKSLTSEKKELKEKRRSGISGKRIMVLRGIKDFSMTMRVELLLVTHRKI